MGNDPISKQRAELEKRKGQLSPTQRAQLEQRLGSRSSSSIPASAVSRQVRPNTVSLGKDKFVAPHTKIEQSLAAIWCSALGLDQVSIYDNFFELGGHSLLAAKVAHQISRMLGVTLSMRDMFDDATIAGLVSQIEKKRPDKSKAYQDEPISKLPQQKWYDISHAQRRILIIDQADKSRCAYIQPQIFTIKGVVDAPTLEQAFIALVERHEILRTAFLLEQGDYRQVIYSADCFHLNYIDARDQIDQDIFLEEIYYRERTTPFALDTPPLFHASLINLAEESYVLLITAHHIILDGWSEGILINDLYYLYETYRSGQVSALPPLPIQYKDYAAWHNALVEADTFDKDLEYFLERFAEDIPPFPIPTDKPRPSEFSYRGDIESFRFGQESIRLLQELITRANISMFMLSFSTLAMILYSYRKQREIVIGTVTTGQIHPDMQGLIGFFVNTLPIKIKIEPDALYLDYLQDFKQTLLGALDHQHYPFDKLIDALGLPADRSRSPLFDILVIGQDFTGISTELPLSAKTTIELKPQKLVRSLYDLKFEFAHSVEQGIFLNLEYNTDLFARSTILLIQRQLEHLIVQIANNPHRRIGEFDYRLIEAVDKPKNADLDFDISF
jgi:hypothetical protein